MKDNNMTANKLLKDICLAIIDILENKNDTGNHKYGRPSKCTNSDYIDYIFYVLKTGIGWEYLRGAKVKGNTVHKKFIKWGKMNVYCTAWIILVNIYAEYKLDFSDLFLDASHVKNYGGQDLIGKNHYDRFRTSTKLSIIVDIHGVPIGMSLNKGNVHDLKLVIDTIESISLLGADIFTTEFLVADKGYISDDMKKQVADKFNMQLITENRRTKEEIEIDKQRIKELKEINKTINKLDKQLNDKKTINDKNEIKKRIKELIKEKKIKEKPVKKLGRKSNKRKLIEKRIIVEHTFSWFKKYTRLLIRKDKHYANFENFVFMAAANITANKINSLIIGT